MLRRSVGLLALAAAVATAGAFGFAASPAAAGKCIVKSGEGWGWSKGAAQFQSFEIIQQVTGNWPFQSDDIKITKQVCKQKDGSWTCWTTAKVCSK